MPGPWNDECLQGMKCDDDDGLQPAPGPASESDLKLPVRPGWPEFTAVGAVLSIFIVKDEKAIDHQPSWHLYVCTSNNEMNQFAVLFVMKGLASPITALGRPLVPL